MITMSESEKIDDENLIIWFKRVYKNIEFIKFKPEYKRIDRFSRLEDSIKKLKSSKKLFEQKDLLIKIWKDLVANAIIFLKSKDIRECFHDDGDYGIDDLGDFFQDYCNFENLLYGSGDYYRDHVSHVFRVFILGEKLVRSNLDGFSSIDVVDQKLPESVKESPEIFKDSPEFPRITSDEKEAMWCIASLTHDLGYPTEVVNEIHDNLKDMLTAFNVQDVSYILSQQSQLFNDFIIKLLSSDLVKKEENLSEEVSLDDTIYTTHTQAKYYFKYSRSIEKWDHGIESCIVLVKSLVYFLETDYSLDERKLMDIKDARQFLIRQRILRAIASHNCDFIYHLKLDLSFLLRVIDEMQEWGRPKLTDLFIKPPLVTFSIDTFQKNNIEYSIRFSHQDSLEDDDKIELHKNIKEYFRRKINKYIMILRSAVDGKKRHEDKLTLTLNVVDEIESEFKYTFVHENPQKITLKLIDEDITLTDLDVGNWDNLYKNKIKPRKK